MNRDEFVAASRRLQKEIDNSRRLSVICAAVVIATVILVALFAGCAHAQTFRDASGRMIGTATRDSNGTTTFRDGTGRMTGTANTNSNGTTTFYNWKGQQTGTAERRK
jgi:hypothetical protein